MWNLGNLQTSYQVLLCFQFGIVVQKEGLQGEKHMVEHMND
jgi:hypothetical protein